MADTDTVSLLHTSKLPNPQSPKNLFPNLIYKLAFFVVFLALLPLSPSRTPDFVGETISAGIWELLHLLVVGIAISYGLFSCRIVNVNTQKEPPGKSDGAHSVASQIFNVPLVFDDDDEEMDSHLETLMESKCQTRSSLCHRNEPSLVVPNGSKESIALPSPIPWRWRSGKMEIEATMEPGPVAGIHRRREREREEEMVVDPLLSPSNPRKSVEGPSRARPVTTVRPNEEQAMYYDPLQSKYPTKRSEFMENAFTKSDNSDRYEYDECTECTVKEISSTAPEAVAEENEVDRKADEFIAKFREQIRQQRIELIKRSTKQRSSRQSR